MRNLKHYSPMYIDDRSSLFIGRERELKSFQSAIQEKKHRVIAITGDNATGKTLLWMHFLKTHGTDLAPQTEAIHLRRASDGFPTLNANTRLVILEDLGFDFTDELAGRIASLIDHGGERQFVLVSPLPDFVKKFNPETHIHLGPLTLLGSHQYLLNVLEHTLSGQDLAKIADFTQGNPLLLRLIANHVNGGESDIGKIFRQLSDNIKYRVTGDAASLIQTPGFIQVTNDIRVVNSGLLALVRKDHRAIFDLTPRQFEEFVAELMEKRGYRVDLTKATRDGGKDLIVANHADIGNFIFYVECKKYAPSNPVGVNLVRELAGSVLADRVTAGIMVTSSYFSPDAVNFSSQLKHQLSLIDFIKLKDWINETRHPG